MSEAPLVKAIVQRLLGAGYVSLRTPFRVATVEFDFTAALTGAETRSLDLVLIVDTTSGEFGDRSAQRVIQRIEALSRALDVTESRYVVTVILAGAALAGNVERLAETCRVLHVEDIDLGADGMPANDQMAARFDDSIRVLLPLIIPDAAVEAANAASGAMNELRAALTTADPALLGDLIEAAEGGEEKVTASLAKALKSALVVSAKP